jgi:hypothetical protein
VIYIWLLRIVQRGVRRRFPAAEVELRNAALERMIQMLRRTA